METFRICPNCQEVIVFINDEDVKYCSRCNQIAMRHSWIEKSLSLELEPLNDIDVTD